MIDKILIDRSVVEQALEALEMMGIPSPLVFLPDEIESWQNANEALRAALKLPQVEQGPVAWIEHEWSGSGLRHLHFERPAPTVRDEVVCPVWTPLYTHPQPPRQPLTDAQINAFFEGMESSNGFWLSFARAIERAHWIGGEK